MTDDAVRAGASILLPVKDEPWGDRVGRVMDPAGHVWNIARSATARLQRNPKLRDSQNGV